MKIIDNNKFIKRWNEKTSLKEIIKEFDISKTKTLLLVKKLNLEKKTSFKHPYNIMINKRIKKLYWKGYTTGRVALILNIGQWVVLDRLKRLKTDRRDKQYKSILKGSKKRLKTEYSENQIKQYLIKNSNNKLKSEMSRDLKMSVPAIKNRLNIYNLMY